MRSRALYASSSPGLERQHPFVSGDGVVAPVQPQRQRADLQAQGRLGGRIVDRPGRPDVAGCPAGPACRRPGGTGAPAPPAPRRRRAPAPAPCRARSVASASSPSNSARPAMVAGDAQADVVRKHLVLDRLVQLQQLLGLVAPQAVGQTLVRVEQLVQLRLGQGVQDGRPVRGQRGRLVAQPFLLQAGPAGPGGCIRSRLSSSAAMYRSIRPASLVHSAAALVERLQHLGGGQRQLRLAVAQHGLDPLQGRRIGGGQIQHLAPAFERLGRAPQRPFQQPGHAAQDLRADLGRGRQPQLPIQNLQPLVDRALAVVQRAPASPAPSRRRRSRPGWRARWRWPRPRPRARAPG